ncbi:DUF222 domain-containing protein [Cellulomonas hominis]
MGEAALALAGGGREAPVSGLSDVSAGASDASAASDDGDRRASQLAEHLVRLAGQLRTAVAGGAGGAWPPGTLRGVLADLDRLTGVVAVVRSELLLAVRDAGAWVGSGDRSVVAWRARSAGTRVGTAVGEVRQAETLALLPEVAQAVSQGQVSTEHVRVLTRAAGAGAHARDAVADPGVRAELVELVSRVDAGTFEGAVRRLVAAADRVGVERRFEEQRARRSLVLRGGSGGVRLSGVLDEVSGRVVGLALEALCPRPAEGGERSREQRQADALMAMAQGGAG